MKFLLSKNLPRFILFLKKLNLKVNPPQGQDSLFKPLSPIILKREDHEEEVLNETESLKVQRRNYEKYEKSLLWALRNTDQQNFRNIAITGSYGSGKSSILRTFQNEHEHEFTFMPISLATFRDETKQKPDDEQREKRIKLIEASIVQQMIYREKDSHLPDSRFRRISHITEIRLTIVSIVLFLYFLSGFDLIRPGILESLFLLESFTEPWASIIHVIQMLILIPVSIIITYKAVRFLRNLIITKFKIHDVEIGVGNAQAPSVINQHIDEILYFFRVRPYDVVIIEDLDRFEEPEIFTKLRELNILLNNSKKSKKDHIVFIYAVRDDMFTSDERTKFFDFILPVIPVINPSNSGDIISKLNTRNNLTLSPTFIDDISYFIQDMRFLTNIQNEFLVYRELLGSELDPDMLFAMLTYKNSYPDDFVKSSNHDGDLHAIFQQADSLKKTVIKDLSNKIQKLKESIEDLRYERIDSLGELRMLYILQAIHQTPLFMNFFDGQTQLSIEDLLEEDTFTEFREGSYTIGEYQVQNAQYFRKGQDKNYSFAEIERKVDEERTYLEREMLIKEGRNKRILSLQQEINSLEREKVDTRHKTLAELLEFDEIEITIPKEKDEEESLDHEFINFILRNGYIDEDYLLYVSLFHEERKTRNDYKYIVSVKKREALPYDAPIPTPGVVIQELNPRDFEQRSALNIYVVDELLKHHKMFPTRVNFLFTQFKNITSGPHDFIFEYLKSGNHIEVFVNKIFKLQPSMWDALWNALIARDDEIESIYRYVFEYVDIGVFTDLSKSKSFMKKVNEDNDILSIINDEIRLVSIFEHINPKFTNIHFDEAQERLIISIRENHWYAWNPYMLAHIIGLNSEEVISKEAFDSNPLVHLFDSEDDHIISHLEEHINGFLSSYYFADKDKTRDENESVLIRLLNNPKVSRNHRELLIDNTNQKVSDLTELSSNMWYHKLLERNKVDPSWRNIREAFLRDDKNEDKEETERIIPNPLVQFLNNEENAQALSDPRMPKIEDDNTFYEFGALMIRLHELSKTCYGYLMSACMWWYSDKIIFETLSESRISILLEKRCIQPNQHSFEQLKEYHSDCHINLFERELSTIVKNMDFTSIQEEDLLKIMKSTKIDIVKRNEILHKAEFDTLYESSSLHRWIAEMVAQKQLDKSKVDQELLRSALMNQNLENNLRIPLFNEVAEYFENEQFRDFSVSLKGKHALITNVNKRAVIKDTRENEFFLELFKIAGLIHSYKPYERKQGKVFQVFHKRK